MLWMVHILYNAHFSQFSLDLMDFDFEGILKMARLSLISDMGHGLLQDIVTWDMSIGAT